MWDASLEYIGQGTVSRSWVIGQGHRSKKATARRFAFPSDTDHFCVCGVAPWSYLLERDDVADCAQSSLPAEYFVVQLDCFAGPHDIGEPVVICAMSGRTLEYVAA